MPDERLRRLAVLHLDLLGLVPGVSLEDVRTAYRALARRWHPDKFGDDPNAESVAGERLRQVNRAYEWLIANRSVWEPASVPAVPGGSSPQPRPGPFENEPPHRRQSIGQHRNTTESSSPRPSGPPDAQPNWSNPEAVLWSITLLVILVLIGLVVSSIFTSADSTLSRSPSTSTIATVLPCVYRATSGGLSLVGWPRMTAISPRPSSGSRRPLAGLGSRSTPGGRTLAPSPPGTRQPPRPSDAPFSTAAPCPGR